MRHPAAFHDRIGDQPQPVEVQLALHRRLDRVNLDRVNIVGPITYCLFGRHRVRAWR